METIKTSIAITLLAYATAVGAGGKDHGYDVTNKYRGQLYHIEMPYHPPERIKMRIQFSPVI